jgi:photosystem II stability/assembly factor-like uncharacterized protein
VSTDPERDQSTDALLRAALPGLPARDSAACLNAETLSAWSEGSLPSSQAALVDAHLSECSRCQQMLAAFVRTEPAAAAAVPFWQRWPRQWLVPVSAAAVAVIVFAVVARDDAPPAAPVEMAKAEVPASATPAPAVGAGQPETAEPARELRSRAEEGSPGRSAAGGTTSLPAPRPPVNVNPTAGPIEAPAASKADAPPAAPQPGQLAQAAEQSLAKLDAVQVANRPADQSRDNQAVGVLTPGAEADAAAGRAQRAAAVSGASAPPAVIAEIVSAPRPALARTGAGRGGGVRGPESARAAAEDAAAASKLPATIPARWRVWSDGRIERSTNAGATWRPVATDTPVPLTGGSSPSDLVCWLIGPNGAVLLSVDGARFTRLPFPELTNLVSITAVNDRAATIRTSDGRTFVTGDGGSSWTRQ